jgi:hypothetical protein
MEMGLNLKFGLGLSPLHEAAKRKITIKSCFFLNTHAHYGAETWENRQGNRDWVINYYWMLLESNINELAGERFRLLYLNEYMNQLWDSNLVHDDRDIISLSHARLAFAGRSSSRWF